MIQQYELAYQVSPLYLTGGVALQAPNSSMPLFAFSDPSAFAMITAGYPGLDTLEDAFGAFNVYPGGSLVQQTVAKYPFANQAMAGNAIIREPLTLSLIWDTPMRGIGAWATKMAVMSGLKATLDQHNNAGGTYTVVTPAFIYTNLVMTALVDGSRGQTPLPQNAWRFDFERPLIALSELQQTLNQLMNKLNGGLVTDGSQGGIGVSIGSPASQPQSNPGPTSLLPATPTSGATAGVPLALPGATPASPVGTVITAGVQSGTPSGAVVKQ